MLLPGAVGKERLMEGEFFLCLPASGCISGWSLPLTETLFSPSGNCPHLSDESMTAHFDFLIQDRVVVLISTLQADYKDALQLIEGFILLEDTSFT